MSGSANNIAITPMNVFWRIEAEHQITAVADVADSLDGTYFTLFSDYYVWFDGVAAADPAPAGKTAIAVAYTTADTAATLAGLIQAAIDGVAGLTSTVSGTVVTAKVDVVGEQDDTVDVDSGVSVTICRKGKNVDLGLIEGEPSPTNEVDNLDVTAQQTGTVPITSIHRGNKPGAELTLLETTKSQLKEMFAIYGGTFTPAAGTEVFGMGTSAIGKNMLVEAARLEFVPVNIISSEISYNYTVMLSLPVPGSLIFSGENPRTLVVTFSGYPDLSKDTRVNSVLIGDPTQTGI
jgi:hypothetical protein